MHHFATAALAAVVLAAAACDALQLAPTFALDLTKPPAERFLGAVELIAARHAWADSFGPKLWSFEKTLFQHLTSAERAAYVGTIKARFPVRYAELAGVAQGFANIGHPEVTHDFLALVAWYHEIAHISDLAPPAAKGAAAAARPHKDCTALLALPADPAAEIVHGRNLDGGVPQGRNLTLHVVAYATDGATGARVVVYEAVDFYWFGGGFMTAQQAGGFTIQENWRFITATRAATLRRVADPASVPQLFAFRALLERCVSPAGVVAPRAACGNGFGNVVASLRATRFVAAFYAVLSAPGRQGAVVNVVATAANHSNPSENVLEVFNDTTVAATGKWFLVQTNSDRWDPPRVRRKTADATLAMIGRANGATRMGVWQAISVFPVHNTETYYTCVMSVVSAVGVLQGFIREAMVPGA
jgi:N-acylethanolamine-hydrolysing acid amidase